MIGPRLAGGTSLARQCCSRPLSLSQHSPVTRRLRDHPVSPRGDVRYRVPFSSTTLTGVLISLPLRRPRTDTLGIDPVNSMIGLMMCWTNHGVAARTRLSGISARPGLRRWRHLCHRGFQTDNATVVQGQQVETAHG